MKLVIASLICSLGFSHFAFAQEAPKTEAVNKEEPKKEEASAATTTDKKATEFDKPLFFSVIDQELKIKNPRVDFDLQKSKGQELDINGVTFNNNSFTAKLEEDSLNFTWDTELVSGGDISVINEQGKELWKKAAKGNGTWSFKGVRGSDGPQWKDGERFHFCIRSEVGRGYSGMCTQNYAVEVKESGIQLGLAKSSTTPRVIFQNDEKKLKGGEEVAVGTPVQFLATLSTNATYEFVSEPVAPIVKDMIESEKKDHVTITGELPKPLKAESKMISGNDYGKITQILGFESTIAEARDLWAADFPVKKSRLVIPGKSGGIFSYELEIQNPPRQQDRRFISDRAIKGTYRSKDQMQVRDSADNIQTWEFETPQKFASNTVYLDVQGEKATHRSYLEIYRAGAGEASLRLTGVVTTDGDFVVLGEGHVSWWFNDIFGAQNYWLSKQRWGVSARYFTSLTQLPATDESGASEDVDLKVAEADLRYRFTPGLWEKDETVGAIVAYEAMTLGDANVPKLGVGLFWARSMPKSIDTWFSKLPFMNYPKWVDMEFIKYVSSTDSDITLGDDYVLNFHGKVLWTPSFFGEAGFGLKNYYFEKNSDGSGAKLTTFYGTVGLGINF
ncbi:hypothetical protein AZI87_09160 [Bdellovibrio bacteriovorus]|uniref:Uncharacterized protein n=1 Tax=Bdellovibrio bacteriovorus TaxID=959 RepID=A0A161PUZ3_BDEBC|nr:hypothetical protein [Bdellovibrio bacteriovorus]KYG69348.1 hypothetical protein AZI87_09160 [Bdellovibrio bacteriovorus]